MSNAVGTMLVVVLDGVHGCRVPLAPCAQFDGGLQGAQLRCLARCMRINCFTWAAAGRMKSSMRLREAPDKQYLYIVPYLGLINDVFWDLWPQ